MKDVHVENALVAAVLKTALAALPLPDHTGSLGSDRNAAPLEVNECTCATHRAHRGIRSALKEIESHQCFYCTNFDPTRGPIGSKLPPNEALPCLY